MNKRMIEIQQREEEIRSMLNGEEQVDLDAIESEMNALSDERSAIERREAMIAKMNGGMNPMEIREEVRVEETTVNERSAFWKVMTGRETTAEERALMTVAGLASKAAVAIPTTIVEGIWSLIDEMHPFLADVQRFHVRGNLILRKHTAITAGDAAWYAEGADLTDEENEFDLVELTGHQLAKIVRVSYKLRDMSEPEFIAYIQREIAIRMGAALGNAVINGTGTNQPTGVKTVLGSGQKIQYTTLTDDLMRQAAAKVNSFLASDVAIYCNNNTAWTVIAGVKDQQKRPIFINDSVSEGIVGKALGYAVKVDDAMADGDILFANAKAGYAFNVNSDVQVLIEDKPTKLEFDYVGYALADGDVIDDKAFAMLHL